MTRFVGESPIAPSATALREDQIATLAAADRSAVNKTTQPDASRQRRNTNDRFGRQTCPGL